MIFLLLCFFIPFFVYLITLAPTVYVGDSGELTTASFSLGIAHPPGYPLYTTLGKIFTVIIPFGNIAYRVNLMSAVLASTAVFFLYLLLKDVIANKNTSTSSYYLLSTSYLLLSVVLIFAFLNTFWSQATSSEVYTLNTLFVVATLFLVLKGIKVSGYQGIKIENEKSTTLFLLSFVFGLSLCNHHTMILFVPIILVSSKWIVGSKKCNYSLLATCYLLFFLSLCVYLYLPLRSLALPSMNWGSPDSLHALLRHILRQQYGREVIQKNLSLIFNQLLIPLKLIFKNSPFFIISILGLLYLSNKIRIITMSLFAIFIIFLPLAINVIPVPFSVYLAEPFFIPVIIIATIWMGVGFFWIFKRVPALSFTLLALPVWLFLNSYSANDKSKSFVSYEYAKNIIHTVSAKNDVAFLEGDNIVFPLAYLKKVELNKTNGYIFDETGNVFNNIYGKRFMELPKEVHNKTLKRVQDNFFNNHYTVYYGLGTRLANSQNIGFYKEGVLFSVQPKVEMVKLWRRYNINSLKLKTNDNDYMYRDLLATFFYFKGEFNKASNIAYDNVSIHTNIANALLKKKLLGKAQEYYKKACIINPYSATCFYNLGFCYMMRGLNKDSIKAYEQSIRLNEKNARAHYNLGALYGNRGNIKRAVREFELALKYRPDYSKAKEALLRARAVLK